MPEYRRFYNDAKYENGAHAEDPVWVECDRTWTTKASKPSTLLEQLEPFNVDHFMFKKAIEGPDADGAYITRNWQGLISYKIVPVNPPAEARVTRQVTISQTIDRLIEARMERSGESRQQIMESAIRRHIIAF